MNPQAGLKNTVGAAPAFPRSTRKIFQFPANAEPLDSLVGTGRSKIYTSQLVPPDFIPPSSVRACPQHLADHPQRELLQRQVLSLDEIRRLAEPFQNKGVVCIGNTIPAAMRPSHPFAHNDYEKHQWFRDSVVALEAMLNAGDYRKASSCIEEMLTFLALPAQRNRIIAYHFDSSVRGSPHDAYQRDHAARPFIRAPIGRAGNLSNDLFNRKREKIEEGAQWAHDQLGSFGQFIRLVCLAQRCGKIDLPALYSNVLNKVQKEMQVSSSHEYVGYLRSEHILVSLQKFLYRISLCSVPGRSHHTLAMNTRGAWEEHPAHNRLSEMMPLLAGVTEFVKLYEREPAVLSLAGDSFHKQDFIKHLQIFSSLLRQNIDRQLPDLPDAVAIESFSIEGLDSVVAMMLSPRLIKLTALQQFAIIRTVFRNMGIVDEHGVLDAPGIIRYWGDQYCAEDMHKQANEHWNVERPKSFAYWTTKDAPIAANWFRRACELAEAEVHDPKLGYANLGTLHYQYGCRFLQRSLSQVPTKRYEGRMRVGNTGKTFRFYYNPYDPVEAWYRNSETGRFEPNTNVLTWTNAQRAHMLIWAERAAKIYGQR
jgi:hypothetical protein